MGLLNYDTKVSALKTAGEIQGALAKHGAGSVSIVYVGGEPGQVAFTIDTEFGLRNFRLPVNYLAVQAVMIKQQRSGEIPYGTKYREPEHARKVAWRILKDWLLAQLAIIESGMSTLDEVMLPYMLTPTGDTVMETYRTAPGMREAISGARSELEA